MHVTPDLVLGCRLELMQGRASVGGRTHARVRVPHALVLCLLLWVLRSDGIVAHGGIAAGKSLLQRIYYCNKIIDLWQSEI